MDNEHLLIITLAAFVAYLSTNKCSNCGGQKDKKSGIRKEGYDFYGRRENPLYRDA
jgi:hypothetical protein